MTEVSRYRLVRTIGAGGMAQVAEAAGMGRSSLYHYYPDKESLVRDLVRDLLEARDERRLGRLQAKLRRIPLLILDEFGFVPFERPGGELRFNLLADRHERRSTILTTNLAFKEWVDVLGDEKLTSALLDRLASRAHVLTTKGKSYRSRRRGRKKG